MNSNQTFSAITNIYMQSLYVQPRTCKELIFKRGQCHRGVSDTSSFWSRVNHGHKQHVLLSYEIILGRK